MAGQSLKLAEARGVIVSVCSDYFLFTNGGEKGGGIKDAGTGRHGDAPDKLDGDFNPNQFYAPQVTVGYLTQINFDKSRLVICEVFLTYRRKPQV
ncbi:MAG: hypothetical protein F6K09_19455 [Merismopedia sp. SIO2A8]|nr:hypothetical protein [Symploca sp. SIO2B6]NET50824.1 hypothetical protein [Merismopedia sp. SIO2A8]